MCGRFTLAERDLARLARAWAAEVDAVLAAGWRPRWNVAPGDAHVVVLERGGARRLERATFGLPAAAGRLHVNARIETAAARPAFGDAFAARRCAVPADGFFEWEGPARARRPTWFHRPGGGPLLFAGIWSERPDGALAFAILTTAANALVAPLHDRMPVLVPEERLAAWLAAPLPLGPAPEGALAARPVSDRVNSVACDDEACVAPRAPERQLKLV